MKQRRAIYVTGLTIVLVVGMAFAAVRVTGQGKPQFGSWGVDLAGRDQTVKPGDDFFRYANGAWLDHAMIPGDKPGVSLRLKMTDAVEERLHKTFEEAAAKPEHQPKELAGKAGAFYRAFMDEARIDQAGGKPMSMRG